MINKIGLIDPALRRIGHHTYFLSYAYRLLKMAGMEVLVVDFGNVIKNNSDVEPKDIINVSSELPTELFTRKKIFFDFNLFNEYRKIAFFKDVGRQLDQSIKVWIIATYDPYVLPVLYHCGLYKKRIVPIVHYTKFFRKQKAKLYGRTTFWVPHLLLKNLFKSKIILYLDEEHKKDLIRNGFKGKSVYLPYNALSEDEIRIDNRYKLASKFRIGTLGLIRDDKDIHFVMKAVREKAEIEYFIGGGFPEQKKESSHTQKIMQTALETSNIISRFEYLTQKEYNEEIERCHFTIVPVTDKYQKGGQLTGLMIDSLINKRPFIGPDIFPINKYVKEHGLGILYKDGNLESLDNALSLAKEEGTGSYYNRICHFLRQYSVENTASGLKSAFERLR